MRVAFCVDVETQHYFKPSPWFSFKNKVLWNLNKLRRYRYAKNLDGLWNVFFYFSEQELPLTLFCVEPIRKKIESMFDIPKYIDVGSHSATHNNFITMSDEELDEEFKKIKPATSFAAPGNMIQDLNNFDRIFKKLKKKGFKIIRYQGLDVSTVKKQKHSNKIEKVCSNKYLYYVWGSGYFEGTSSSTHLHNIYRKLQKNKKLSDDYIFCLSTHEFTWKKNKLHILANLVQFAQQEFKLVNFKQLVEENEK